METESKPPVFWYARVYEGLKLDFHVIFNGEEEDITEREAHNVMINSKELGLPIICIN